MQKRKKLKEKECGIGDRTDCFWKVRNASMYNEDGDTSTNKRKWLGMNRCVNGDTCLQIDNAYF